MIISKSEWDGTLTRRNALAGYGSGSSPFSDTADRLVAQVRLDYLKGAAFLLGRSIPDAALAAMLGPLNLVTDVAYANLGQVSANYDALGRAIDDWATTVRAKAEAGTFSWETWTRDAFYHEQGIQEAVGAAWDFSFANSLIGASAQTAKDIASGVKNAASGVGAALPWVFGIMAIYLVLDLRKG